MDALTSDIQGFRQSRAGAARMIDRDQLVAKIQSCLQHIPISTTPAPLTLQNLKFQTPAHLIQNFQLIWEKDHSQALEYLKSYQQICKGYPHLQPAFFQIAFKCLSQGYVAEAIAIADSDMVKQSILNETFKLASVPENPVPKEKVVDLVAFAHSFQNEKDKVHNLLRCSVHLIYQDAFHDAEQVITACAKSFESLFGDLFALSPDWNYLRAFALSLNDLTRRESCLELCRNFMDAGDLMPEEDEIVNALGKRARTCGLYKGKRTRVQ